jgi:hypothetical protein
MFISVQKYYSAAFFISHHFKNILEEKINKNLKTMPLYLLEKNP